MLRLEDWRTLAGLLCIAAALLAVTAARHGDGQVDATAHVHVADPIDAWFGATSGLGGDVLLARRSAPGIEVSSSAGGLTITATGRDAQSAQLALAEALAAYEAARVKLRNDVDDRLAMLPSIESVADVRQTFDGAGGVDIRELGSVWATTPVERRVRLVEELVDDAFWDLAVSSVGQRDAKAATRSSTELDAVGRRQN